MTVTLEEIRTWVNKLAQEDKSLGQAAHRRDIAATYLSTSESLGGETWHESVIAKYDLDWRSAISADFDAFIEVVYIEPMLIVRYHAPL